MHVTIIDNYDSFVFNLVRYVRENEGVEVAVFRNDKVDFEQLQKTDAILLSPGPGIPVEAGQLMEVIERFHSTKPIFGVCLGHQAIATFFGAELIREKTPVHGKASNITINETEGIYKNLQNTEQVGRYHSWSVVALPEELQVTAQSSAGIVMSFRHKVFPMEGVQFHPESILTPNGRKMIKNWIESLKVN